MTRDDIIRLAREAGVPMEYSFNNRATVWDLHPSLERFAALVAAAELERMKSEGWRQCAEGQRTTQYCGQLEYAVNAERERYEREVRALQFQVDKLKYECRNLRARGESK
jgi:sugar/nucleoside kinase (ribokinase family)